MKRSLQWFAVAALLAWLPGIVSAQTVRGTITARTDSIGIPGVLVMLVNRADNIVARSLSNSRGEYRVAAPLPGTYRLRTMRIGFRPVTTDPFELSDGQQLSRRISLADVAFLMDTVKVAAAGGCSGKPDPTGAVFAMWEQVRTALIATQVTAQQHTLAATTVSFERSLDADGIRVRNQGATLHSDFTARPWATESADSLARFGFVVTDRDGSVTYYAPDLDVLLSEQFLVDHCIRPATSRNPNLIGIAFEPTKARGDVPEIRGTVWVSKRTSELQNLEYRYVNVSRDVENALAGGDVEFVRMSNGAWIIHRWEIRMPVLSLKPGSTQFRGASDVRVDEIRVNGGSVALVTSGRDTLFAGVPVVLAGGVVDSVSGKPISGASVSVPSAHLEATADGKGRFSFPTVLPGRYDVVVRTASLDSLGAVVQKSTSLTEASYPVSIRVPTPAQLVSGLCGGAAGGLLSGIVRLAGDSAAPGSVNVIAQWSDDASGASTPQRRSIGVKADAGGRFRICGLPLDRAISVHASGDSTRSEPTELRIAASSFARTTIVAERFVSHGGTLIGVVFGDANRTPVADVEVSIPALGLSSRTNARGEFSIADIAAGPQSVAVRRVGFGPFDAEMKFTANQSLKHEIFLTRVALLDSMKVIAAGSPIPGFDERRKLGLGSFLTRAQLEKQEGRKLSDVLTQVRSVKIIAGSGNHTWLVTNRGVHSGNSPSCSWTRRTSLCMPSPACAMRR